MSTRLVRPGGGRRAIWLGLVVFLLGVLVAYAATWRPPIEPVARPLPSAFSAAQVERGSALASLGSCAVCHTSEQGATFAGSRALPTPFGTIYTTNITPDVRTGIGAWSREAFRRAMKAGVSRDGHHLYPALPYVHFTHATDEDLDALYAYFMTRQATEAVAPANRLIPPLGFRPLLAGWKLFFLRQTPFEPDPTRSVAWNRGAYLVEGLGHCAACHSPLNSIGGEKQGMAFAGGEAEGWKAPPLDATNPRAGTWSVKALHDYLRGGIEQHHSVAAGPMGPVTHELAQVPEADVSAIAVYVASLMNPSNRVEHSVDVVDRAALAAAAQPQGAEIFAGACAGCHEPGAPMTRERRPLLSTATTVLANSPDNALQAMFSGIHSPEDGQTPYMPSFHDTLTDDQAALLAAYIRLRFTNLPEWSDLRAAASRVRAEEN